MNVKLSRHVQSFYQDMRKKVDKEFETQKSLQKGHKKLETIESELKKQKKDLEQICDVLGEKQVEVVSWLEVYFILFL